MTKLSPVQFAYLSAMAACPADGQRAYIAAQDSTTCGTRAACARKGLTEWDTLDGQVAHRITAKGRAAVAAHKAC